MSEPEARSTLEPTAVPHNPPPFEDDEPPSTPRRHLAWQDVPQRQWDDWRWQMQNAIRSVRQLRTLLRFTDEELEVIGRLEADYKLVIPPYYFSLIDPDEPERSRFGSNRSPRHAKRENPSGYELEDPLEEDKDSPVPGVTHRYPDRALLITTPACSMYCRFCTRKRATLTRGGWDTIIARRPAHGRIRREAFGDSGCNHLRRRSARRCRHPSCGSSSRTWAGSRTST